MLGRTHHFVLEESVLLRNARPRCSSSLMDVADHRTGATLADKLACLASPVCLCRRIQVRSEIPIVSTVKPEEHRGFVVQISSGRPGASILVDNPQPAGTHFRLSAS